ncbi:MAG TPA: hypothetical protein VFK89_06140, partial [Actinomycetota bacterium]|nr:hypothetical protein [Actinomycetota bacterium]
MRALRSGIAAVLIATLIGAFVSGSAGATPPASYPVDPPRGPYKFGKPVSLTSFSPLRTGESTVYTARSGKQQSDHEWSGEPSLQIDDKGTIYIAGTCCVGPAAPVWYSTDNGKTFKEMETPGHAREWGIGAEGDLAVDHDGHVWFVDTYVPGLLTTRWSDNGKTWDFTSPTAGTVPGFDDRPWLTYSKDALYLYVNHVSHTAVYRSTDGGMSWDGGTILQWQGNPTGQPFFPAHLAANEKTGKLWVVGVVSDNGKSVLGSAVGDYVGG